VPLGVARNNSSPVSIAQRSMSLRPDLLYKRPDTDRLAQVAALVGQIEDATDARRDTESLVAHLRELTGRDLSLQDVRSYPGAYSLDTFVAQIAMPPPRRVVGLSRFELVGIAQCILNEVGDGDEAALIYYMELFDAQVSLPGASSLAFHPPADYKGPVSTWSPTADDVVDIALRHKPIAL
jgi:hypothetical protein